MPRIGDQFVDLKALDANTLNQLPNEAFRHLATELFKLEEQDRQQNQLLRYQPPNPRTRTIFKSRARLMGIGGGNGCLPLDAPVLMADATWKPLGEICLGDVVMAADPETGVAVPAPVTHLWRSGTKQVYKVEFSDGGWFEATEEHMVPMYLMSGRKTTKGNAKKARKRRLGDYIEPINRRGSKNPSKRISCVSPRDIQFATRGLKPIHPYLLGVLLGDGEIGLNGVKFSNTDEGVLDRVRELVEEYGCELRHVSKCTYGITRGNIGGRPNALIDAMRSHSLDGKTSYTKFIPKQYLLASREDRMQLLAGLIDTDGSTNEFSTCSPRLAEDFCLLVRSLGGKASSTPRVTRSQRGTSVNSFRVYWRLNEMPPVAIKRKFAPSQAGREIDYTRRVCRSAKPSRVTETGDIEVGHPAHCYITRDYVVVSNSGKTTTAIVKALSLATGVIPDSVRDDLRPQFRGPINVRIIVQSLTTVLDQIILPKMQWWKWTGVDMPGGAKGHWGWIPKMCLVDASWDRSYSKKNLTLTVLCRNPDNLDEVMGTSMIHFMSHEQAAADAASGDFHIIVMDEPPKLAMFRESQARTMRVNGQIMLAMTWPDDPTIPVDWIFDEIYEPGQPGPSKNPDIDWFELWTEENTTLNQASVAEQAKKWSEDTKNVRLYGRPIRFSNRIHPLFTDVPMTWSVAANQNVFPIDGKCPITGSSDLIPYCHVEEFDINPRWPTIFVIDPHPRKPHMFLWAQIDPSDDLWIAAEGALDADPVTLKQFVDEQERFFQFSNVAQRLIDPNMGSSPSSSDREKTWQSEMEVAGLRCDLADDVDVGRKLINEYLKVDNRTRRPRLTIHTRCHQTVYQMKRYVWDNYRNQDERDLKTKPRDKYDDYPTMLKYLLNSGPSFRVLNGNGDIKKLMNSPFKSAQVPKRRDGVIYRDDRV